MIITDATHLPRLIGCNPSNTMPASPAPIEQDDTVRNEGNAVHWLAQQVFEGKLTLETARGVQAYNGIFITADMVEHVGAYISALWCGEMEVITSITVDGFYQINSRADHIGWNAATATLDVDDLKYGYSTVEPDENWTLIAHAIGYCADRGIQPATIRLRIHQPRAYHPLGSLRTWPISWVDLQELYRRMDAILRNPSDQLQTGQHCYRCPSMALCPAYRNASMNAIDATSHVFTDAMADSELADEVTLLNKAFNVIKQRKQAMDELALHRAKSGAVIPGYMIDRPKGQTRYKTGINADMVFALTGKDVAERKLPSISTLKNLGIAQMVIDAITDRPEGSARLVKVDTDALARKKLQQGAK